jgi:hypothetical protein
MKTTMAASRPGAILRKNAARRFHGSKIEIEKRTAGHIRHEMEPETRQDPACGSVVFSERVNPCPPTMLTTTRVAAGMAGARKNTQADRTVMKVRSTQATRDDLRNNLPVPDNRTGDEMGKEDDEKRVVEETVMELRVTPDVHDVADLGEGEERDGQRQDDVGLRERLLGQEPE